MFESVLSGVCSSWLISCDTLKIDGIDTMWGQVVTHLLCAGQKESKWNTFGQSSKEFHWFLLFFFHCRGLQIKFAFFWDSLFVFSHASVIRIHVAKINWYKFLNSFFFFYFPVFPTASESYVLYLCELSKQLFSRCLQLRRGKRRRAAGCWFRATGADEQEESSADQVKNCDKGHKLYSECRYSFQNCKHNSSTCRSAEKQHI